MIQYIFCLEPIFILKGGMNESNTRKSPSIVENVTEGQSLEQL